MEIYLGLKRKWSYSRIARKIGMDKSTVCREVRRNAKKDDSYVWKHAQALCCSRKHGFKGNHRKADELWWRIDRMIEEDWSPGQISVVLRNEGIVFFVMLHLPLDSTSFNKCNKYFLCPKSINNRNNLCIFVMTFALVYYTLLSSMVHWCNLIMEINEYSKKSKEYETSLLTTKKKSDGIYYTDINLSLRIIEFLKIPTNASILDPCCGTGNFIISAKYLGYSNLYGSDIDKGAVNFCKNNSGISNIHIIDSLSNSGDLVLKKIGLREKVDFVVGNPLMYLLVKI